MGEEEEEEEEEVASRARFYPNFAGAVRPRRQEDESFGRRRKEGRRNQIRAHDYELTA